MTREEAKEKVFENNDGEIFYQATYDFIDKIYDDFESRTCEDCVWDISDEYMTRCALLGDINQVDFGCNKFVSTDTKGD